MGLGGGSIYNPVMLSMGVPPSVSSSTAMYIVMFTNFGSSLTYLLIGTLNINFGLWIGGWSCLGSIGGMLFLNWLTKRYNRQSPIVIILTIILGLSALLVPIFGAMELIEKSEKN